MTTADERYTRAIQAFDAANAEDPNREFAQGQEHPKELLYAQRMSAMLERFAPGAPEVLRLAARCQHIRRWRIPRDSYPAGRSGYQQWRSRLMIFHAEQAGAVLAEAGYGRETIDRVGSLLRKERLKLDPDVQALEDVIALVFLEDYLEDFVARHRQYDEATLLGILRKTWLKMSERGREAALSMLRLPQQLLPLIRKATEES